MLGVWKGAVPKSTTPHTPYPHLALLGPSLALSPTGSWFMLACKIPSLCNVPPERSWAPVLEFHILSLPPTSPIQLSNGDTEKELLYNKHRGGT